MSVRVGQSEGSQVIPVLQRLMSAGPGPGGDDRSAPVVRERGQVHTLESLEKMHTSTDSPAGHKKPEVRNEYGQKLLVSQPKQQKGYNYDV